MFQWLIKSFLVLTVICLTVFLFVKTSGLNDALVSESIADEKSDDVSDDDETRVVIINDYKAIHLDEEAIAASGLAFEPAGSISFKPEISAYAEVVNIAPLVSLKAEHQVILAERKVVQNNLHNHNKILKRAEALHKVKSLSTRDVEKNRADRDLIASRLNAMNTRLRSFEYKIKSLWGDRLSSFIIEHDKQTTFDELASYKTSLILLSFPKGKTLIEQQQKVFVNNLNQRDTASLVTYLGQSTHVANALYGESYLYLLKSQKIRVGMKLFAWIEEAGQSIDGIFIPESAVIWYANQAWIYLKHGEALFVRKPLGDARKISNGWFLKNNALIGNDLVVTRGGQTLLSEEFKWAIPDEDDD